MDDPRECPDCGKAISEAEWPSHQDWHRPPARDPLWPNGGRPLCSNGDGSPVYLRGLCSSCYAAAPA